MVSLTVSEEATEYVPAFLDGSGAETVEAAAATLAGLINSCTGALKTPVDITAARAILNMRFFMVNIPFKNTGRSDLFTYSSQP